MLFLVPSVFLFYATFYGVGYLAQGVLRLGIRRDAGLTAFLGVCFSAIFFSMAQFFTPLNVTTLLCVLAVGIWGIVASVTAAGCSVLDLVKGKKEGVLVDILLLPILCAYISSFEEVVWSDTLLYHSSIVSWLNFSKIVPGLANLHFRLGTNSAYLILAAGIDVGPFDKYSSSILPCCFWFITLKYLFRLICDGDVSKNFKLFLAVFTTGFIIASKYWIDPNLYYDISSMTFAAIIFIELLLRYQELFGEKGTSNDVLFIFATMSFAIKQTGAIMVVAVFVLGLYDMVKAKGTPLKFARFVAVPLVFGIVYIARNIIQTGCPLFPLQILAVDLKWTSREAAQGCFDAAKYYARLSGPEFMQAKNHGFLFWFIPWLKRNTSNYYTIYLTSLLISLFLSIKVLLVKKLHGKKLSGFLSAEGLLLATLAYWFMTAPEFRFVSIYAFLILSVACYFAEAEKSTYLPFILLVINVAVTSEFRQRVFSRNFLADNYIWMVWFALAGTVLYRLHPSCKESRRIMLFQLLFFFFFVPHGKNLGTYPAAVGSLPVKKIVLKNGQTPPLEVYVPKEGDECGDAPLPCTPYPNDELRLIVPGDITKGFYIGE